MCRNHYRGSVEHETDIWMVPFRSFQDENYIDVFMTVHSEDNNNLNIPAIDDCEIKIKTEVSEVHIKSEVHAFLSS